jgi:murein DD-endopeptidase MepM/ murein hydrolase activator NlpD
MRMTKPKSPPRHLPKLILLACVGLWSFSLKPADVAWQPQSAATAQADPATRPQAAPFQAPFALPPGPSTWLVIQPYGNTVFAYRLKTSMYVSGQGFHFGIDLAARCGTPVVAIGAGTVVEVDSLAHGAGPHNLMIDHANGYASFYGHLLERPGFKPGQTVQAGQEVALSGDPDGTCTSRPHLHLEIRDAPSHRHAFNPIPLIDVDWNRIALASGAPLRFEQDLEAPQTWQTLYDQPDVTFGGKLLNAYKSAWPPEH